MATVDRNFSDLHSPEHPMPKFLITYIIIFGFSSVVGSIGNILVIATVLCDKKLKKIKNAFIVSLAVADFWVSSVTMPASIIGVLLGRQWFEHHYIVCAFTSTVCAPACMASVCSIAWIAVHRYFYIGQYGYCVTYFSRKRVLFYIIATWLSSFLIHLPNHLGWGQTRYSFMLRFCSLDTDLLSYAIFYAALVIMALIVSFVFYVRIYHLLRSTNLAKRMIIGPENSLKNNESLSKPKSSLQRKDWQRFMTEETKIIKVSFRIFVVFLVTWSPLSVLFMIQLGGRVPPYIYLFAGLLAHCNSTLNFIFYFLQDNVFQKSLKRLVAKILTLGFYWSDEGFTRRSKTIQDGTNNNYSIAKDKSPLLLFMMNNGKESDGKTSSEIAASPKENEAKISFTMTIVFRKDHDVSWHDSDVEL